MATLKNAVIAAIAMNLLGACAQEQETKPAASTPETSDTAQAGTEEVRKAKKPEGDVLIASGSFSGLSDHITTGDVSIILTADGYKMILADNFSLDGAPDPTLAFGNGDYVASTNFSKLNNISGKQEYALPKTLDPRIYTEVYVWCEKFSVPLGVARLSVADNSEALDDTYGS